MVTLLHMLFGGNSWDGKPIPYWLFKLHGLNIEYKCQICGGFSYWGRMYSHTLLYTHYTLTSPYQCIMEMNKIRKGLTILLECWMGGWLC
jgi:hypothetical protein